MADPALGHNAGGTVSRLFVAFFLLLLGCAEQPRGSVIGDAAHDSTPLIDVSDDDDPIDRLDGEQSCVASTITPPAWLESYERHIVGSLSGEREVSPGVRLNERGTAPSRQIARDFLSAELRSLGLDAQLHDYGSGENVVATLPSTTRLVAPRVVLGAHFDSVDIGPGAADNATGVALVLSAARWLIEVAPCRTHDVIFVLFDQEEIGLVGSEAFAARLVTEGVEITAVHCFDMLSWDRDSDRTLELWLPTAEIRDLYAAVAAAHSGRTEVQQFELSDHASFVERGLPAVGVCEEFVSGDRTPYYHTANDTYDKVDFNFLGLATTIAVDVVFREITAP